jgi:predicted secreted protein
MEIRETLDKDSVSGYAGGAAGQRSGSLSFEGLGSEDIVLNAADVASMATLLTQFSSDTAFAWKFTTDATGDVSVTGNGLISDISISAAVEENATLSGTVTMIGAPTFGTVA